MSRRRRILRRVRLFWRALGPGLITGASDDDPSAITTYSQAGARYGLSTLWMAIFAYPVLAVLQETCARIGIVTGKGLTGVVKSHYPKWVLYLLIALSCPAFLCNMGADIAILGDVGHLLLPSVPALYCSMVLTSFLFVLMWLLPYKKLMGTMKFVCLVLLVYAIVPFLTSQDGGSIIRHSLLPSFHMSKGFFLIIIGLIGAIISPYIFFWQTSSEVDALSVSMAAGNVAGEKNLLIARKDILAGAFFAVLIMYFVILTTGTILNAHHIYSINTVRDAAMALRPLGGDLSYFLFSAGVIATGFLIIPVLSASISFIITEAFDKKSGFNESPGEVRLFYFVIAIAMILGIAMHWLGFDSVKVLLFTTTLYGFISPFVIALVLHIANNKKVMGPYSNNRGSNLTGSIALLVMLGTLIGFVCSAL